MDIFVNRFPFPPEPIYFQDFPGALREFAARKIASFEAEQPSLPVTLRAACEALDWTIKTDCSCGVESPDGSLPAKSLAGWADDHLGSAVVFPVPPPGTKDTFANALAAQIGLPPSRDANGVRAMLPEILRRSGMALVLADAQNLLRYRYKGGSPSLVEWMVTFAHEGIAVALCVGPQFLPELKRLDRIGKMAWQPFEASFCYQWRRLETPAAALEAEASNSPEAPASREAKAVRRLAESLLPDLGERGWKTVREFVMRLDGIWGGTTAALMRVVDAANAQARLTGRQRAIYTDLEPALKSLYASANALESGRPENSPTAIRLPARVAAKAPARLRMVRANPSDASAAETVRHTGRQMMPSPGSAGTLSEAGESRFNSPLSSEFCSRRTSQESLLAGTEAEPAVEMEPAVIA